GSFQGRVDGAGWQPLGAVGRHDGAAVLLDGRHGRDVASRDFDRGARRGARQQTRTAVLDGLIAHSTNVTLLISRSVVTPASTRSTADSRRKRMPSSRAAFLISDVGRRARSRPRSLFRRIRSPEVTGPPLTP